MSEREPIKLHADPSKQFFVNMLIKDIQLARAILDLVDNSVDGGLRQHNGNNWAQNQIRLTINEDQFRIEDNCGGIPLDIAINYAFLFGRSVNAESTIHSIGQFGVGMKRAFFKLGREIQIKTISERDSFVLNIDVAKWEAAEDWDFEVTEYERYSEPTPVGQRGTLIEVSALYEHIKEQFSSVAFNNQIKTAVADAHSRKLQEGLYISVNGTPLSVQGLDLIESPTIRSGHQVFGLQASNNSVVLVHIFVGISKSSPRDAGWNVYCNGRLVTTADQSSLTGWGEEDEIVIPKYHNQFARFRGLVFFECDDASLLPWNTTKTGVDTESPVFIRTRKEMIAMMRPVLDFLNELDREKDLLPTEPKKLREIVELEEQQNIKRVDFNAPQSSFEVQADRPVIYKPRMVNISYSQPKKIVDRVKESLGVSSLKSVGEQTFNYYYLSEIGEVEDES